MPDGKLPTTGTVPSTANIAARSRFKITVAGRQIAADLPDFDGDVGGLNCRA
jgi:hypothetical protein